MRTLALLAVWMRSLSSLPGPKPNDAQNGCVKCQMVKEGVCGVPNAAQKGCVNCQMVKEGVCVMPNAAWEGYLKCQMLLRRGVCNAKYC